MAVHEGRDVVNVVGEQAVGVELPDRLAPAPGAVGGQASQLPHRRDRGRLVGHLLAQSRRILVATPVVGGDGVGHLRDQDLPVLGRRHIGRPADLRRQLGREGFRLEGHAPRTPVAPRSPPLGPRGGRGLVAHPLHRLYGRVWRRPDPVDLGACPVGLVGPTHLVSASTCHAPPLAGCGWERGLLPPLGRLPRPLMRSAAIAVRPARLPPGPIRTTPGRARGIPAITPPPGVRACPPGSRSPRLPSVAIARVPGSARSRAVPPALSRPAGTVGPRCAACAWRPVRRAGPALPWCPAVATPRRTGRTR